MSEENIYTFENEAYRKTYWHTCSHVLAQAVKRLWPEVKLAIGPSIDNGFYYDLDAPFAFTPDNLTEIEAEMRKICKEKLKLERFELPREEALKFMEEKGGICGVHCENAGVIDALIEEKKAAGEQGSVGCHPRTRPDFLEAEAVGRILRIAQAADAPVVIVHTTNAAALSEIDQARARGQVVYSETCPQYLALDDSVYYQEDWLSSAKFVCSPPIRKQADQDALWAGLKEGRVNTVSTDHCSFTTQQKLAGQGDFTTIPGGLPGVETRGEVVYTTGVAAGRIDLPTLCRALSENPAKLYGLYPRKGCIAAGADADIVVYDPAADHTLRAADMVSRCDYTPFEGFRTSGSIAAVYLRGMPAVESGVVRDVTGEYLKRGKCAL